MSIATALFTDSQTRVLRWLFGQPERGYHLNELLRLTGLGSASLQRELKKLAEAGLVRPRWHGNKTHAMKLDLLGVMVRLQELYQHRRE